MKNLRLGSIALALSLILPMACASSPPPSKETAEGAAPAGSPAADESKVPANTIRVFCSVYRIRRPLADPSACRSIDFALEDLDGVEIARKNPDAKGTLDFAVPADKAFRVIPRVSEAWTIEWEPPGDLKAGDSVRVILRR